jgi:transcriptional regulator with XRE-family HTH domain
MHMPGRSRLKLPPLNIGKETIGQRIAQLRKERGYTQAELSEKMGIIQPLISDYELDKLRLHAEMVIRVAQALEVSTDELLGSKAANGNGSNGKGSLRLLRRVKRIEDLPQSQQKTLLKTIDTFLKAAGSRLLFILRTVSINKKLHSKLTKLF